MGKMKIGPGEKVAKESTRTPEAPFTDWEMETPELTDEQLAEFKPYKPKFEISEVVETIEKPNFKVVDVETIVEKPNYIINEAYETVLRPNFEIRETTEVIQKPVYVVKDVHVLVQHPIISAKIQLLWPAIAIASLAFSIYSHFVGH